MTDSTQTPPQKPNRPTVLVVGKPRPMFIEGLTALLDSEGFEVVGSAADMEEAARRARGHKPMVVMIGPQLLAEITPESTHDLVKTLVDVSPGTKILLAVNGAEGHRDRLIAGLEAGAAGLVDLHSTSDNFIQAVRDLAEGKSHVPSNLAMGLLMEETEGVTKVLSPRERDVLTQIALGYTSGDIATHLHLSVRTIESHRARIHKKLGTSTRAELVRIALDEGMIRGKTV